MLAVAVVLIPLIYLYIGTQLPTLDSEFDLERLLRQSIESERKSVQLGQYEKSKEPIVFERPDFARLPKNLVAFYITQRGCPNVCFVPQNVAKSAETSEFPIAQFRGAAAPGFTGVLTPEEFGGNALGNVASSLVLMEINRACASTGVTLSVHNSLCTAPLVKFGTEDQKRRYLSSVAEIEK